MAENLKNKARNYFLLGVVAYDLQMYSEAATNFFKALFAVDDAVLLEKTNIEPKDHTERFNLLRSHLPRFYDLTDKLFNTYRRTYTQELNREEVALIRKRVMEAFENAQISLPSPNEIKNRFEELLKKGKVFS